MPIASYLVIPSDGAAEALTERLAALPGCDVVRAESHNVLLLVTDTPTAEADEMLRDRLQQLDGIRALVLTFGGIAAPPSR